MPYLMWKLHPWNIRIVIYNIIGAVLFITCLSRNAFIQKEAATNSYKNNFINNNADSREQRYRSLSGLSNLPQNALYAIISNNQVQSIYQMIPTQPGMKKINIGTAFTPGGIKQFSEKPEKQGSGKQQKNNSILNNASK